MPFRKLDSKKKSEYVVEQILGATKKGVYNPGDKLPSEQLLSEMVGVSRLAVREASGALRLVGIMETKVGNGTHVKRVDEIPPRQTKGKDHLKGQKRHQ